MRESKMRQRLTEKRKAKPQERKKGLDKINLTLFGCHDAFECWMISESTFNE